MTAGFDLGRPYEKHPQVAIRREEFGGLAYHFGNRRLVFLKGPELVVLVEASANTPPPARPWPRASRRRAGNRPARPSPASWPRT